MADRGSESGFSLVALIAAMTIMTIMMMAGAPHWKYIMQDMREEELFSRGVQIAEAIDRYKQKNGGALPTSLDVLVKGKFLRKAYTDPMVKHGKWRFIRQGETVPGARPAGTPLGTPPGITPGASPKPGASPPPQTLGPFMGVASTSQEKSLRLMNGRDRYDQWLFIAGQTHLLGRQDVALKPGQLPGGQPQPGQQPTGSSGSRPQPGASTPPKL